MEWSDLISFAFLLLDDVQRAGALGQQEGFEALYIDLLQGKSPYVRLPFYMYFQKTLRSEERRVGKDV